MSRIAPEVFEIVSGIVRVACGDLADLIRIMPAKGRSREPGRTSLSSMTIVDLRPESLFQTAFIFTTILYRGGPPRL